MIHSIGVTNENGDELLMELSRPELSGLVVVSVDGIGPLKALINQTDLVTYDGTKINNVSFSSRNIILNLRLLPNPTIEESRYTIYKYFKVGSEIRFRVDIDKCRPNIYEIKGIVEDNKINLFSKEESAEISIICPNPYFYDVSMDNYTYNMYTHTFDTNNPYFQFPFSNESTSNNLIQFGEISIDKQRNIFYKGSVKTGCFIKATFIEDSKYFSIYNLTAKNSMKFDFKNNPNFITNKFSKGDILQITTYSGEKEIWLYVGSRGYKYNALSLLDKDSSWFFIKPGDNLIAYSISENEEEEALKGLDDKSRNVNVYMEYKKLYNGV